MAAGMRYGYARAMWNILGLQLGILFVLAIVAGGPGRDHRRVDDAVHRDQVAGRGLPRLPRDPQWRAPAAPVTDAGADVAEPRGSSCCAASSVNATNPKGIVFMLAVLPQFIDPALPQLPQYVVCGATLFFTDLVVMSGYTGLAAKVLRLLREPHHVRWINRTFGGLFVAAGAVLATFRRAA
jgi:homoserine/homoserine lactone efflux protein